MQRIARGAVIAALIMSTSAAGAADFPQPLPEEPVPTVLELPERYPDSWVFVHDLHFNSLPDGRAAIVDVGAEHSHVRGQIPVAQFGNILPSTTRGEIYVGETFLSRLTRGERTDVITIWDTKTLAPKDEIVLPGGKRGLFVTLRNSLQLTNDEKWALVFNFTPGSSVTVVDLESRKILSDIDLPGCSLVYPTGPRGFTSLCADPRPARIAGAGAGTWSWRRRRPDRTADHGQSAGSRRPDAVRLLALLRDRRFSVQLLRRHGEQLPAGDRNVADHLDRYVPEPRRQSRLYHQL